MSRAQKIGEDGLFLSARCCKDFDTRNTDLSVQVDEKPWTEYGIGIENMEYCTQCKSTCIDGWRLEDEQDEMDASLRARVTRSFGR